MRTMYPKLGHFFISNISKILLLSMERPLNLKGLVSFRFPLSSVLLLLARRHSLHIAIQGPRTMKGRGFHLTWSSKYRCSAGSWEIGTDREFHGSAIEIKPK